MHVYIYTHVYAHTYMCVYIYEYTTYCMCVVYDVILNFVIYIALISF